MNNKCTTDYENAITPIARDAECSHDSSNSAIVQPWSQELFNLIFDIGPTPLQSEMHEVIDCVKRMIAKPFDEETEWAAFEEWAESLALYTGMDGNYEYIGVTTHFAWQAWLASAKHNR